MERRDPRTHAIIGARMAVHSELGCGFLESVYQEALEIELCSRSIPFRREVDFPVFYREQRLRSAFRCDFVCYDDIIVELKAMQAVGNVEKAQIINYLKVTGRKIGLLLNFGSESLEHHRFIY